VILQQIEELKAKTQFETIGAELLRQIEELKAQPIHETDLTQQTPEIDHSAFQKKSDEKKTPIEKLEQAIVRLNAALTQQIESETVAAERQQLETEKADLDARIKELENQAADFERERASFAEQQAEFEKEKEQQLEGQEVFSLKLGMEKWSQSSIQRSHGGER
jgi:hypothetical protein